MRAGWLLGCLCFVLTACIWFVPDKKKNDAISATDTTNAYAKDTSIVIDSSTVKQFFSGKTINTKGVHPKDVLDFSKTLIGVPYRYGSTDPRQGFDCSGFITYVFNHFGIIVPRSSIDFTHVGRPIPYDSAKPGDLILFTGTDSTEKFVGHMGLIVSNENKQLEFIHATSGKNYGVTITPLNDYYISRYIKTIRIFPQNEN
jgi:cell wall-associated NlpC family hydrolase